MAPEGHLWRDDTPAPTADPSRLHPEHASNPPTSLLFLAHHLGPGLFLLGAAPLQQPSPLSLPLVSPSSPCSGQSALGPRDALYRITAPLKPFTDCHHYHTLARFHTPAPPGLGLPRTVPSLIWNPTFSQKGLSAAALECHTPGRLRFALAVLFRGMLFLSQHPSPRGSDQVLPSLDTQPGAGVPTVLLQNPRPFTIFIAMRCHCLSIFLTRD